MRFFVLVTAGIVAFSVHLAPLCAQDDTGAGYRPASWLKVNGEVRGRSEMETFAIFEMHKRSFADFTRMRLGAEIAPLPWFRFTVQLQDARTLHTAREEIAEMQDNFVDLQYGFAEFGAPEAGPWKVRVGRQLLAFGDERLVGADSTWDNRAQRFNGVRTTLKRGAWQWDLFSATPVEVFTNRLDPIHGNERLSGAYGRWSGASGLTVDPYLLWDRIGRRASGKESGEVADRWTPGLRISAPLPFGFDTVTEMAAQRGRVAALPVSGWAGYWEIGHQWEGRERAPHVMLSYSYASGDHDGADRRIGTFHDLLPAGYNACGFFEPFAWRNIRDLRAGAEWKLDEQWLLTTEWHGYWLATLKDGVYVDGGDPVAYNPQARSSGLGRWVLATAQRSFGRHVQMAFGYAKFFRAAYLRERMSLSHSAFISWTARL